MNPFEGRPGDTHTRGQTPGVYGRPGDVRGFVHKRIGRAFKRAARAASRGALGIVSRAGIPVVSGAAGLARGVLFGGRGSAAPFPTVSSIDLGGLPVGGIPGLGNCQPGFVWNPIIGKCLATSLGPVGAAPQPGGSGAPASAPGMGKFLCRTLPDATKVCDVSFGGSTAVMGQYGAALTPAGFNTWVTRCPTGMKLGKDGLCYNKLANSERKWPKGRAPLLTGGDMRCISKASTAAKKLERTTKRLRSMGMMKKLPSRTQKALPPARNVIVEHGSGSVVA